jgi:AraC family transcriptional regulator of adaptative response / DNA-3-methyladenine glycosylase II
MGVLPDADTCYAALTARDARFDGLFFVGVSTTGIYCRPLCPARTPRRDRCTFFARAVEAEKAGFRACFRCRPELAPGLATVDSVPRLVRAATALVDQGFLDDGSVEALAARLGVSARHLRRAMEEELGVSPLALAASRRLALAKQLVQDTRLPMTEVAFAAGFQSVRRFDAAFVERFGRAPSSLRREARAEEPATEADVVLRLDYRRPYDLAALLGFLGARAIPGVEGVDGGSYRRTVRVGDRTGWIAVAPHARLDALTVTVAASLVKPRLLRPPATDAAPEPPPRLLHLAARVRALFDLDARPDVIATHLSSDPALAPAVAARPGLRVPGAFDPFETTVRAILGQQVSVAGATTLSGRLVARFGEPLATGLPGLTHLFPPAATLAGVASAELATIGLPAARASTITTLARAVASGALDLADTSDPAGTMAALQALPGVGPWTAQYVAMRALRWPDAFPAGDLVLRKALGVATERACEARAAAWRPWRAYAALYLWSRP